MCLFHKWSGWEQYHETGVEILTWPVPKKSRGKIFKYIDTRQKRTCKVCGKMQDRLVR